MDQLSIKLLLVQNLDNMKNEPLFTLQKKDATLFEQMKGHYQSEEERIFFETMCYKEQREPAYSNEALILEDENEDNIFIIRCSEHEYEYGRGAHENPSRLYVDTLSDMLTTNLQDVGIKSMQGTMLDWLRSRDYQGIRYDRNYALM